MVSGQCTSASSEHVMRQMFATRHQFEKLIIILALLLCLSERSVYIDRAMRDEQYLSQVATDRTMWKERRCALGRLDSLAGGCADERSWARAGGRAKSRRSRSCVRPNPETAICSRTPGRIVRERISRWRRQTDNRTFSPLACTTSHCDSVTGRLLVRVAQPRVATDGAAMSA